MLSFNNRVHIQLYLPELFHIITTLIATGPPFIRASVHGLIVNLIQSLCTAQPLDPSNLNRLNLLLTELSEPNFKLFFGLNNVPENAFEITGDSVANLPDDMPLSSLETIVQALLEVMICGAPSVDVSNTWRARWMGLVASTAFQHNPAIQPRAFVALGCLACEEVDDDLLYQILVALGGALDNFSENDCSLIQSIIMCLTNIVEKLSRESQYLRSMFWLTMALIQIGHIPIFQSAVNLLQVVLRALEAQNFFVENDLVTFLLSSRRPLEKVTMEMDIEAGINYSHFSFAVAAVLLKGLKNPLTKTSTQAALLVFLDIAAKGVNPKNNIISSSMLGYLAALLPMSAKDADMKGLLGLVGISDIDVDDTELQTYFKIFEKLEIPDNRTALLLISLMVTMLHHAESEAESLFLYGFLSEAAKIVPESFALIYDTLLPKMSHIVSTSDTISILDAIHSILYTVVSEPLYKRTNDNQYSYLSEIGFNHLMDCGSFQNVTSEKKAINARLSSKLVQCIINY